MKNLIFLFNLSVMFFSVGCSKNELGSNNDPNVFLSADKNDSVFWKTNAPYSSISRRDKIIWIGGSVKIKPDRSNLDEQLIMQLEIADLSDLKNTIIKDVDFSLILEGDIVVDRYLIDTTNINNQVTITDIDERKKILKGVFNVTLVRAQHFSANGEKIIFKSGVFSIKYTEN